MPPLPDPALPRPRLTRDQLTRLSLIDSDLNQARIADLAELDPAALILLVERLRGSLDDAVHLIGELSA